MNKSTASPDTIVLAALHHHNAQRVASQRIVVDAISAGLTHAGFQVVEVTSAYQPPAPEVPSWSRLAAAVVPRFLDQQFFEVRESRRRKAQPEIITLRKRWRIFKRALELSMDTKALTNAYFRQHIEACLSSKHLDAWLTLLNTSAQSAIVVEDDALLGGADSPELIVKLLNRYAGNADYVDLAGGYTREELGIAGDPNEDIVLDFMLANTTCAYIVSRRAAEALVNLVFAKPEVLYLAPDFLIGLLSEEGFEGRTVLPSELPLVHGSRSGQMASTIPY